MPFGLDKIKKCGIIPQELFLFDLGQVVFFDFSPERFAVDPQSFGGPAPISVMVSEDGLDIFFFDVFQGFEFPVGEAEKR